MFIDRNNNASAYYASVAPVLTTSPNHAPATMYQHSTVPNALPSFVPAFTNHQHPTQRRTTIQYYRPPAIVQQRQNGYYIAVPATNTPAQFPPVGSQSSLFPLMTQSMYANTLSYDAMVPQPQQRPTPLFPRYVKNNTAQRSAPRAYMRQQVRTEVAPLKQPAHHASANVLCNTTKKPHHRRSTDSLGQLSLRNGRLSETRTSNQRLQSYYTLVWEDEESVRHECPSEYSDSDTPLSDEMFDEIDDDDVYSDCSGVGAVRSGGRGGGGGGGAGKRADADEELESRQIRMGNKRFYVDVKQNWRGRYLKLAEVIVGGSRHKSRVLLSMPLLVKFREHIDALEKFTGTATVKAGDDKTAERPGAHKLSHFLHAVCTGAKVLQEIDMKGDDREYTILLKENERGKFILVSMSMPPGARAPHSGMRNQVAIPHDGLGELSKNFGELLDKWNKDLPPDHTYKGGMPEPTSRRCGNKTFYFDYGQNARGVFVRVSEVTAAWRTSITIPRQEWAQFRDIFAQADAIVAKDDTSSEKQPPATVVNGK